MKKSFKKLGFVSLATSSVLLGSMNATDLETYAATSGGTGGDKHTASSGTPAPSASGVAS